MIDINYRQMMMIMLPLMGIRRIVGRLMNSILTQLYHDQRSSSANNMPRGGVLETKQKDFCCPRDDYFVKCEILTSINYSQPA